MFLFYYIWGFFFYIVSLTHNFVEKNFLAHNNPFLIQKRTFKFISYFEKLFLVLFYKKGWFEKSMANLYRKKDIIECRRNFYPLINLFHLYSEKSDYKFEDLKFIVLNYNFFLKSKVFKLKLLKLFNFCFKIKNKNFIKFLIIQKLFFNKYFNTNSSTFFKDQNYRNLVKLNFVFNIFLLRAHGKYLVLDLNKWPDWYFYVFSKKIKKYYKKGIKPSRQDYRKYREFKFNVLVKWINMVYKYKKIYKTFSRLLKVSFSGLIFFRFSFSSFFKLSMNRRFYNLCKNYYTVKFSESSVTKYINPKTLKNYNISYLRKNRIFNKGRYSRNRQLYRTGVYWCLWLNIIMVYGLYFMFYRFSFNFGYIWWGILILAYSTIFSRIVKYNFFNIFYIIREFSNLHKWYGYIFLDVIRYLENSFDNYLVNINIINYIAKYKNNKYSFYFDNYYHYLIKFYKYWINNKGNADLKYMWQGMKEKDTSFLRYKTVIHWFKEAYRIFIG